MEKLLQVIMLPTEKANLVLVHDTKPLHLFKNAKESGEYFTPQHLYILSDEEIKEGDWIYHSTGVIQSPGNQYGITGCKKIIATTDKSLLYSAEYDRRGEQYEQKFQLPQIPQSFIEAYIKASNEGKPITEVMVEYEEKDINPLSPTWEEDYIKWGQKHKPNIQLFLKVNSKDNTITIKRVKDSWNREEMERVFQDFLGSFGNNPNIYLLQGEVHQWIEQNL